MGVQYRRAHPTVEATAESGITKLSLEAMAALPASLRGELRSAVITLNAERISQAIGRVTEYDRALGSALRRYAQTFAYTPILNAIEAGNGDAEASGGV